MKQPSGSAILPNLRINYRFYSPYPPLSRTNKGIPPDGYHKKTVRAPWTSTSSSRPRRHESIGYSATTRTMLSITMNHSPTIVKSGWDEKIQLAKTKAQIQSRRDAIHKTRPPIRLSNVRSLSNSRTSASRGARSLRCVARRATCSTFLGSPSPEGNPPTCASWRETRRRFLSLPVTP
jgi:hypothetical protein